MIVRRQDLAEFVRIAIARAAPHAPADLGITISNISFDDQACTIDADLSDGSRLVVAVMHVVPRGHFDLGTPS